MSKLIIGIHGLANKPERAVQRDGWITSIREGLERNLGVRNPSFAFDDVYWADLMYPAPLRPGPAGSPDDAVDGEPYIPATSLVRYDEGALDELRTAAIGVVGSGLDAIKATVGMDPLSDAVLKSRLKDLDQYYDPASQIADRDRVMRSTKAVLQDELANCLRSHAGEEILLIAHSMGSIIAYDVLRNLGQPDSGLRVPWFVTIGSPLGLPQVKLQVVAERADGKLRTPTIVTRTWLNFADKRDPVAFDAHLADDYDANAAGVMVRDELVLNDYVAAGKRNHHKLYGYLRAPEVSEHIQAFLTA